jgi:uncharacterized protein YciI
MAASSGFFIFMSKKMRQLLSLLALLTLIAACNQSEAPAEQALPSLYDLITKDTGVGYDSTLVARLGSDEYGMKPYVMAFLKAGPNRDQDSLTAANLQKAHLENITRMAEEGKLVLAGPFMDDGVVRGIYIFDVASVDSARAWTATDPAIQAGRLEMELHPWYGSAVLPLIVPLSKKVEKTSIAK